MMHPEEHDAVMQIIRILPRVGFNADPDQSEGKSYVP